MMFDYQYGKMFFELKYPDYEFYFKDDDNTYFYYRGYLKNPKDGYFSCPCDVYISIEDVKNLLKQKCREEKLKRLLKND